MERGCIVDPTSGIVATNTKTFCPFRNGDTMNIIREVATGVVILALLASMYIALCWVVL